MRQFGTRSRRDRAAARIRRVVTIVRDRKLTFMAGALAYAAFLSLVPILVLVITVGALVRGDAWVSQLMALVESQVGPRVAEVVGQALGSSGGMVGASLVGVAVFLWSATRVFRGLDVAMNAVYGQDTGSFVSTLHDGIVALTALVLAVATLVSVEALVRTVVGPSAVGPAAQVLLWLALTVTLLPVYVVLPNVSMSLRESVPGAGFTAFGWLLLADVFQFYVAATGESSSLFGGIVLLLTLLYFAMFVLLVGVVVNAVIAGRGKTSGERTPGALN